MSEKRCPTCGLFLIKEIVELSPAYMWDCPNCGRENFQRSITLAMSDEDRLHMGLGPEESGCWQSYPDTVICRFCEQQYKTKHVNRSREDNDEGEEDDLT